MALHSLLAQKLAEEGLSSIVAPTKPLSRQEKLSNYIISLERMVFRKRTIAVAPNSVYTVTRTVSVIVFAEDVSTLNAKLNTLLKVFEKLELTNEGISLTDFQIEYDYDIESGLYLAEAVLSVNQLVNGAEIT